VWQGRKRLAQLEQEIAAARAEQAALQRRVDVFEQIAAAAGAALDDTLPGAAAQAAAAAVGEPGGGVRPIVPPVLLAAAADPRPAGSPVRLAVNGSEVIAVVGDEGGDPRQWWTAIRELRSRQEAAGS
jgi:hypothetical protein